MKCGKLTAKFRDAVPVRFYENGREIKRFKNCECQRKSEPSANQN